LLERSEKERTRKRVPLAWATTQNHLGLALRTLGERENGTTKLEQSIDAFREALKERSRESTPLFWAMSFGNQGISRMIVAERREDYATAEIALNQIRSAYETLRDAGHQRAATYYETHLRRGSGLSPNLAYKFPMESMLRPNNLLPTPGLTPH
jgi:hypothetical protein